MDLNIKMDLNLKMDDFGTLKMGQKMMENPKIEN